MTLKRNFMAGIFAVGLAGACAEPVLDLEAEGDAGSSISAIASVGAAWAQVDWDPVTGLFVLNPAHSYNPIGTTTINNNFAAAPRYEAIVDFGWPLPLGSEDNRGTSLVTALSPDG